MPIKIKVKGTYDKTYKYFHTALTITSIQKLKNIAEKALEKLKDATPKDSNLTANSWGYEIIQNGSKGASLYFTNSNVKNGVNIAIILDAGHATVDGRWIEGKKYLDKVTKEIYDDIMQETWEELKNL
mgnify:FL=1